MKYIKGGERSMKIILTKFDVLKILLDHFDIPHYHITGEAGKPVIELESDEIYWEGNFESNVAKNEGKQAHHKN